MRTHTVLRVVLGLLLCLVVVLSLTGVAWAAPVPPNQFPTSVRLVSLEGASEPAFPTWELALFASLAVTFVVALAIRLGRPRSQANAS